MIALIPVFLRLTDAALARGLLQGYRTSDETAMTVKGQIRFGDQMRRRGTLPLPVEIRYDDFTEDIDENRLLRAATHVLRRLPSGRGDDRKRLRVLESKLEQVSLMRYHPANLPNPSITRLNRRYAPALAVAQLVLKNASLEVRHGSTTSTALLFNMNRVFEDFVVIALRTALGTDARSFPQGCRGRRLKMDTARQVTLRPDLSWWHGNTCVFVGDAKYKRVSVEGIEHPDLYQLLTYTVATHLTAGLLIYAAGEAREVEHVVHPIGKRLLVRTVDLSATPDDLLKQLQQLADLVRELALKPVAA
jgi:5-methylcytosine-specific restriction enzyme subunit McrC